MNIFVLDTSPARSAEMLCDYHLRKMCVETAQILSGVILRQGKELLPGMPRPQNINHPVIKAVNTPQKINWVINYYMVLLNEYYHRFGKDHVYEDISVDYFNALVRIIRVPIADPEWCAGLAKCCGEIDVSGLHIVEAYRKYYIEVKKPQLVAKNLWKFTNSEDWTNGR